MAIRKHAFVPGEYYHIYNRGNSKREIFLDNNDYQHFIKCLFICNTYKNFKFRDDVVDAEIDAFEFDRGECLVSVGAWVLMPNHFHIYLIINKKKSHMSDMWKKNQVSEFMRKLSTAYSKYFNAKYDHTGGLFEGAFKSVIVLKDVQAKYLFSYIHLNCIKLIYPKWKENGIRDKEKSLKFLVNYKWSSYLDHKGIRRKENLILNLNDFPKYFNSSIDFDVEIFDWINNNPHV